MGRYLFVVHSNPVEGREQEYNDWYSNQHFEELLTIPGVLSARRFTLADQQAREVPHDYKYLAIYEVETDQPQGFIDELISRSGTGKIMRSQALANDVSAVLWRTL